MTGISKALPLTMAMLVLALPVHSQTGAPAMPMHPPITGMQNHAPFLPRNARARSAPTPAAKFSSSFESATRM